MGAQERPGRRSNTPGPTGRRVAANLRQVRDSRGLSTVRLASALSDLGQPFWPTAITKIEAGDRRVDVDDLVALTVALDTTPNRLLLSAAADDAEIELTPDVRVPAADAWEWATGEHPLRHGPAASLPETLDEFPAADERLNAFRQENRPNDPGDAHYFDKRELRKHPELLRRMVALVRDAKHEGVPGWLLHEFVELAVMTAIDGDAGPTSGGE